jgi:hypothetical protein
MSSFHKTADKCRGHDFTPLNLRVHQTYVSSSLTTCIFLRDCFVAFLNGRSSPDLVGMFPEAATGRSEPIFRRVVPFALVLAVCIF